MADKKITALTDLSTGVAGADLLHVVDDPTGTPINKKVSVTNFINNLPSFIGFSNSTEDISSATQTAISVATAITFLETTGTNAATSLADGTVVGQIKIIVHDTAGGTSEMTPDDALGWIDADFATETSNLSKQQILNQAATAMLAQANQSKQSVLSLLQ